MVRELHVKLKEKLSLVKGIKLYTVNVVIFDVSRNSYTQLPFSRFRLICLHIGVIVKFRHVGNFHNKCTITKNGEIYPNVKISTITVK